MVIQIIMDRKEVSWLSPGHIFESLFQNLGNDQSEMKSTD